MLLGYDLPKRLVINAYQRDDMVAANEILSNIKTMVSVCTIQASLFIQTCWLGHVGSFRPAAPRGFHFTWCFSNFCPASVGHKVGGSGFFAFLNVLLLVWVFLKNWIRVCTNYEILRQHFEKHTRVAYVHDSHYFSQDFVRIVKGMLAGKFRIRLWIGCSFCCSHQVPSVMRSISSSMSAELSSAKDSSASSWHTQL